LRGMRYELLTTSFEIALAEGLMLVGQHPKALTLVDGTIDHCRRSGDAFALPELLRIKAGILKVIHTDDVQAMLAVLEGSIALSREQGAWAWELRSTMDLARFWLEQGQPDQARTLLGACRERASEGFDSLDLRRLESFWQSLPVTPA